MNPDDGSDRPDHVLPIAHSQAVLQACDRLMIRAIAPIISCFRAATPAKIAALFQRV
ncbi:hypothetical protein [Leptolyngbya sp. CCY15150]|uniref:hypothetical protein n=1 Tax=Leptolyngbya sp. CCY15150 TaxID=2767772 RepID=UPI00194F5717|nr:hypothetical protein [Leptolyngbya sp. CCY15150]